MICSLVWLEDLIFKRLRGQKCEKNRKRWISREKI